MSATFNIIRPSGLKPKPSKYEEKVAEICAGYFQSDIKFVLRGLTTTPDIQIIRTSEFWEIKHIRGRGKHTIEDNLRKASKQSSRVIISLLAAPGADAHRVEGKIRSIIATRRMPIKAVLLITKAGKVVDIR